MKRPFISRIPNRGSAANGRTIRYDVPSSRSWQWPIRLSSITSKPKTRSLWGTEMNMRNPPTANTLDATRLSLIALLFGFSVMSYFDRTIMSIAGPQMMKDFGLSATEMGSIYSAFILGYALLMMPPGLCMHGAARLTAEPASRSCSSLTDRPILR